MPDDHCSWNDPVQGHPRAQTFIAPKLWDCVNEGAPLGSDGGADAYYEYRAWRSENPNAPLVDCIAWVGDESQYFDAFTFDATVIATVLGQLVDEGCIDADAKPFARTAIRRQVEDADEERAALLHKVEEAIEAA